MLSTDLLAQISDFIARRMGLHFPMDRWDDLARGLVFAARQENDRDAEAYARRLLSSPLTRREIETLASHLTVGETYFFREKGSFDVLEQQVLPELIRIRRSKGKRLRIWSAGCCTGEEPYSLAILLDRLIADLTDWNITILATDINPRFLEAASAGVYGEWSFRAIAPEVKERYFSQTTGRRMRIAERIRRMVIFSFLNLAEDAYPSVLNDTNAMDVVFCRNVLMYFTPEQATQVAAHLHEALVDDGWLLVSPSETSQTLFSQFTTVTFPQAILYRKAPGYAARFATPGEGAGWPHEPGLATEMQLPVEAGKPEAETAQAGSAEVESPALVAQALANHGKLEEALAFCDRAVVSETLNPAHRFLRAMVAQELGMLDEARKSLEQALYLDCDYIMAHVALGNLAKRLGRHRQSQRHLRNALSLLARLQPESPLSEAAGLTAGRLTEILCTVFDGKGGKS